MSTHWLLLRIEHLLISHHLLLLGIVNLLLLLLYHAWVDPLAHWCPLHMLLIHQINLHLLLLLLLHVGLLLDRCRHRFGALRPNPSHVVLNLLRLKTVVLV